MKTGLLPQLRMQTSWFYVFPAEWLDNQVLFNANGHLWEVGITPGSWKSAGPARQITSGSSEEESPRAVKVGGGTRIVFSARSVSMHLWGLKLDMNAGKALGELEALPHSGGSQGDPSASADGSKLVYVQAEPDNRSFRVRDLVSGRETTLLSVSGRPCVSPDGSLVAYMDLNQRTLNLIPIAGGEATRLLQFKGPGHVFGWSPDGAKILYWEGNPVRYSTFDAKTRQSALLISHREYNIHDATFSPDQRWLAFHTPFERQTKIWIAPVRDGRAAADSEWITVIDLGTDSRKPWWSPDGNLLYFFSNQDGFHCLYAQRLDASKHPAGRPFPVYHSHQFGEGLGSNRTRWGMAKLPGRIIVPLFEGTSNVWIAERKE